MLSILFWNINKKQLLNSVFNLTIEHKPDILVLAESTIYPSKLIRKINRVMDKERYIYINDYCDKLDFYTKLPREWIQTVNEAKRFSIKKISHFNAKYLVCCLHLSDNIYHTKGTIYSEAEQVRKSIIDEEEKRNTRKSIVIGDFNMNPFEEGLISAYKFSSVNSKDVSEKRIVDRKEYEVFYNPSWKFYSDANTAGTFYLQHGETDNHYWNVFDQVLIRPNLLQFYSKESLKLLKSDGKNSLVNSKGKPDKNSFSDHLPIFLKLNS